MPLESVYTDEQIASAEAVGDKARADRMRYTVRGTPEVGDGVRLVPPEELAGLVGDPRFRRAVDVAERVEGHEKGIRAYTRAALKRIGRLDMHAAEQARAIELQMKKKGK